MFPLLMEVFTISIFLLILQTKYELIHWLMLVGTRVSVSKSDVNDDVSLEFQKSPN